MSTVNVNDEAKRLIESFAVDRDCSQAQAASELIVRGAGQPAPPPASVETLDAAAELFLRRLPEHQVELIRELAKDRSTTPAAFLLSYAKLAHERGETAVLIAEPDLESVKQPPPPAPGVVGAVCAHCGKPFEPSRQGQRFCPEPVDGLSCGRQALLAEIHMRRAQRLAGRPAPLAAPPAPVH